MPLEFPPEYPEILVDLALLIHQRLAAVLLPDRAAELARELAEDVRHKWGGGLIYIPQGARYNRQRRDATIWREFNGRNHAELAHRHNLTLSCVYDIIARERAFRQGDLLFRAGE
jgi:Mor family transcriptional regulator